MHAHNSTHNGTPTHVAQTYINIYNHKHVNVNTYNCSVTIRATHIHKTHTHTGTHTHQRMRWLHQHDWIQIVTAGNNYRKITTISSKVQLIFQRPDLPFDYKFQSIPFNAQIKTISYITYLCVSLNLDLNLYKWPQCATDLTHFTFCRKNKQT